MYGDQLSSASVEVSQTYKDLFIDTVRTSPVGLQNTPKIYDNFGYMLGISKLAQQDYDLFSVPNTLQSYRQQLRLLQSAFLDATTTYGLAEVGQAYTGIAPIFVENVKERTGWTLTTYAGSVVSTGDGCVILDKVIPRIGAVIPVTGSVFSNGSPYRVSWSRLGTNTQIHSAVEYYSTIDAYIYVSASVFNNSSFAASMQNSLQKAVRADMQVRTFFTDAFAYTRFAPVVGGFSDPTIATASVGYIYNYNPTVPYCGSVFTGSVMQVPPIYSRYGSANWVTNYSLYEGGASYQLLDWNYDWLVYTRNDATYQMSVRTYASASIPNTVYYKDFNPDPITLLGAPSGSLGMHYVFDNPNVLNDISGNQNNLQFVSSYTKPLIMLARNDAKTGLSAVSGSMAYTGSVTNGSLNFTTSFSCEMWVSGVDTSLASGSSGLALKIQAAPDTNTSVNSNGIRFNLAPGSANRMELDIKNGSTTIINAPLTVYPVNLEAPERFHYFAWTYCSGSVYMYVDDQTIYSGSTGATLPTWPNPSYVFFGTSTGGFALDEVLVTNTFLTPEQACTNFQNTKPRMRRNVIGTQMEQYQQPQITMYASGSTEIEAHQFSIRGIKANGSYILDPRTAPSLHYPIFKQN
jgi:hypothetical protein